MKKIKIKELVKIQQKRLNLQSKAITDVELRFERICETLEIRVGALERAVRNEANKKDG